MSAMKYRHGSYTQAICVAMRRPCLEEKEGHPRFPGLTREEHKPLPGQLSWKASQFDA